MKKRINSGILENGMIEFDVSPEKSITNIDILDFYVLTKKMKLMCEYNWYAYIIYDYDFSNDTIMKISFSSIKDFCYIKMKSNNHYKFTREK